MKNVFESNFVIIIIANRIYLHSKYDSCNCLTIYNKI